MQSRQKGITFIGWLILLVPVAIVGYAGIRLAPMYLNYMKVAKAMTQVSAGHAGDTQVNPTAIRNELINHLYIDSVTYPTGDALEVVRDGEKWAIQTNYEDEAPLFADISLVIKFAKRSPID
ncbi:MAG: DUF4845 domain-containing protein [Pseudomonadota bacterium]